MRAVAAEELIAAARALRELAVGFSAALVTGEEARRAAEELTRCERAVVSARLAAVMRAADGNAFPRGPGGGDAADWAAKLAGCGRGQAADELRLADRLEGLDATSAALAEGRISLRQAMEIALTASEVEGSEAEMLALALRADLKSLKDRGRALRQRAISPDELAARQRKARSHRTWVNELGMECGSYAVMPGEGKPFHSRLNAETDRRVAAEKVACNRVTRSGQLAPRQTREQHAADAFVAMLRDGGGKGKGKAGRADIVLVGDDRIGSGCHIVGDGPVPVATLRELLEAGVQSCGRRYGLQRDHKRPVAAAGVTSSENLQWLCWLHHQEKTEADRAAGLLTPSDPAACFGRGPP